MHSYIQVLSTPTADTAGTAVALDVGQTRYMFGNLHEGLQRVCIQRNVRLAKTSEVFITGRTEWKNVGGLFGLILTIADANAASAAQSVADTTKLKKPEPDPIQAAAKLERQKKLADQKAKIFSDAGLNPDEYLAGPAKDDEKPPDVPPLNIHGGKNLTHVIATGRRFIFRKGTPIQVHEQIEPKRLTPSTVGRDPDWTDHSIQVWNLPIEPSDTSQESKSPPRKRPFDEFAKGSPPRAEAPNEPSVDHKTLSDDELRKFVVSEMFNSQWKLDALVEAPLKNVTLPAITWVRDPDTKKLERYYPPTDGPMPDLTVLVRTPWPGALIEKLPPTKPSKTAMSYIVRHHPQRGKFLAQKAKDLNVDPQVFQVLQRGATVKSRDGATVTPDMVLEPTKVGGGFAMVDIPSVDYLHNLLIREEWNDSRIMDGLQAIVWNLGPGVAGEASLRAFMLFHQGVKHIVAAPDISPNYIAMDSTAALVIRLNLIDPQRYSIPIHSNVIPVAFSLESSSAQDNPESISRAVRDYQLQLEPRLAVQSRPNKEPFLDTRKVLEEVPTEVLELARAAQSEITSNREVSSETDEVLPSPDAEIVCLGTGSSAPSKYRNVSGTLLRVPGCGSYLFDAGEGTLGQLRRLYTPSELQSIFRDLKMIWISHMHADHHLGTVSVIKAFYEANYGPSNQSPDSTSDDSDEADLVKVLQREKKLFVFSATNMIRWLEDYSSVEVYGYDKLVPITTDPARSSYNPQYSYMEWKESHVGFRTGDDTLNEAMKQATGMTNLVTCHVDHCSSAQAVSVQFPTGFKFSYSGDCRPSKQFVQIGQDSTVLLHEATFDDTMQTDAEAKKHSTMSEAIGVARAMKAKRLVLTHFSQRYQKIPELGALDQIQVKFDDPEISNNEAEAIGMPNDPEIISRIDGGPNIEQRGQTHSQARSDSTCGAVPHIQQRAQTPPEAQTGSSHGAAPDLQQRAQTAAQTASGSTDGATPDIQQRAQMPPQTRTGSSAVFSPAASPTLSAGQDDDLKIAIAFDFLRVRVGEIAELEKFMPTMQRLFEIAEEESKAKARDNPALAIQKKKEEEKEKRKEMYGIQMQGKEEAKAKKRKGRRSNEGQQGGKMEAAEAAELERAGLANPRRSRQSIDEGEEEKRLKIRNFLGGEVPTADRLDPTAP
ncbi:MAG: hypothetical protein Q9183_003624 [Haloplaca sp. 2 TL-2023]